MQGFVGILIEDLTMRVSFGKIDRPQLFLELFFKEQNFSQPNRRSLFCKIKEIDVVIAVISLE